MKTSKRWLLGLLLGVFALAGIGLGRAYASGPFFHGFRRHHAPASSPELAEQLARKAEHLMDGVGASSAQRQRMAALVNELSPELFELMNDGRALRTELREALLAKQSERERIESLRARLHAFADRLVDTGMGGLAGVSEILTPAQRRELDERLRRMHQ